MHRIASRKPNVVMTAPGRALKRLTTIQKQQKLLEKYRKRLQKLQAKIRRQRYLLLQMRFERLEIAYRHHPKKPLEEALRKLRARLQACI